MGRAEEFDSFFRATRAALVHQTFALTGDLPAAQGAVRDAYVAAWHHWHKVSTLEDPQDWVRPRAWQLAQRRHQTRIWHRNKGLSAEESALLDAIAKLPLGQRRALLLTQLAGLSLPLTAREIGVPQQVAERHLQSATANLSVSLDIDSTSIRSRLLSLGSVTAGAVLPRASIIRRAGRKRRRTHTAVAAAAATLVAIASGAFAYQPSEVLASDTHLIRPKVPTKVERPPVEDTPSAGDLLDEHQVARLGLDHEWDVVRTHDNTSGDGINTVCQQHRFADPDGLTALVRHFAAAGKPTRSAVQTMEVLESETQAEDAFATTVGWYAGCHVARLQLLTAYRVDGIGNQAHVLMLRVWEKPVTTYSVAVARIGPVVTSTIGKTIGGSPAPPKEVAQSLADAVAMLCAPSGAERCSSQPEFSAVPPPPSGEEPGVLAVADLPPVGRLKHPWVGTSVRPARINPSATVCDRADFRRGGANRTRTRTFLIPEARLPARFGLSETYGVFASSRASTRFMSRIRTRVDNCEDRNLATQVRRPRTLHYPRSGMELATWDLETEISDDESVLFKLGFVRVHDRVAQVTFSPTAKEGISAAAFRRLVVRAGDRLRELE